MASVVHRLLAAAALSVMLVAPAGAWASDDWRRLQQGEVVVVSRPHGNGGIVEAAVLIDAPPRLVYALLADPLQAPTYSPGIVSSQILEDRGDSKRVRMRLQYLGLIDDLQEIESVYTPFEAIRWQQVKGRFGSQIGEYRVTASGSGTLLSYRLEIDTGTVLPVVVVQLFLRSSVPQLLRNIRTRF